MRDTLFCIRQTKPKSRWCEGPCWWKRFSPLMSIKWLIYDHNFFLSVQQVYSTGSCFICYTCLWTNSAGRGCLTWKNRSMWNADSNQCLATFTNVLLWFAHLLEQLTFPTAVRTTHPRTSDYSWILTAISSCQLAVMPPFRFAFDSTSDHAHSLYLCNFFIALLVSRSVSYRTYCIW